LEKQEKKRRVTFVEGHARPGGNPGSKDEVIFFLTLFPDQVSLNLPASTLGQEFISRLTEILGPPSLEPIIKCGCSWGEGVMGAASAVLWNLSQEGGPERIRNLLTFLGTESQG
jgi:hypothetical protein